MIGEILLIAGGIGAGVLLNIGMHRRQAARNARQVRPVGVRNAGAVAQQQAAVPAAGNQAPAAAQQPAAAPNPAPAQAGAGGGLWAWMKCHMKGVGITLGIILALVAGYYFIPDVSLPSRGSAPKFDLWWLWGIIGVVAIATLIGWAKGGSGTVWIGRIVMLCFLVVIALFVIYGEKAPAIIKKLQEEAVSAALDETQKTTPAPPVANKTQSRNREGVVQWTERRSENGLVLSETISSPPRCRVDLQNRPDIRPRWSSDGRSFHYFGQKNPGDGELNYFQWERVMDDAAPPKYWFTNCAS